MSKYAISIESLNNSDVELYRDTCNKIHLSCLKSGFFIIKNHGIPLSLIDKIQKAANCFFSQPTDIKNEISMDKGGNAWRGWFPLGGELTSGKSDQKEGYYFGREGLKSDLMPLHGENLWPKGIPELKPLVLEYLKQLENLSCKLIKVFEFNLKASMMDRFEPDPTLLFRLFSYPPSDLVGGKDGVHPHSDYGILTILWQNGSGLEIRGEKGNWLSIPQSNDTLVVNLGDMMELWTNGVYKSSVHRVKSSHSYARLSMPFFFDPSWNAPMTPLKTLAGESFMGRSERWDQLDFSNLDYKNYGEFLLAKVKKVFPNLYEENLK